MLEFAVIIKHPYRDDDYRVDIYEAPDDWDAQKVKDYAKKVMLGPFIVVSVTQRISKNKTTEND